MVFFQALTRVAPGPDIRPHPRLHQQVALVRCSQGPLHDHGRPVSCTRSLPCLPPCLEMPEPRNCPPPPPPVEGGGSLALRPCCWNNPRIYESMCGSRGRDKLSPPCALRFQLVSVSCTWGH